LGFVGDSVSALYSTKFNPNKRQAAAIRLSQNRYWDVVAVKSRDWGLQTEPDFKYTARRLKNGDEQRASGVFQPCLQSVV